MAPNAGRNDFSPSSAHIYGIAVVNGAAPIPEKPQSVLLEAAFWNGQEPVLGLFRYYNVNGIHFERNQRCFIHSSIATFEHEVVLNSQKPPPDVDDEFDIMGDIFYIIPLPDDTPAKFLPTVTVTGKPASIIQENQSFDINIGQWTSFGKEKALFSFIGNIPQNGRWTDSNRPFPNLSNPKYVSVIGFLTSILQSEAEGTTKRFTVDIHSLHFLGPAPPTYPKTPTPGPKGKRKAGLEFDNTPTKKSK